jgi:hypothetical protein
MPPRGRVLGQFPHGFPGLGQRRMRPSGTVEGRGQRAIMWQPLSYDDLRELIENAEWLMEPPVRTLWDRIKVEPRKWQQSPWGDEGGGFWVVAMVGQECVYYNDIEDGFNSSPYTTAGQIEQYGCEQTDLLSFMTHIIGISPPRSIPPSSVVGDDASSRILAGRCVRGSLFFSQRTARLIGQFMRH